MRRVLVAGEPPEHLAPTAQQQRAGQRSCLLPLSLRGLVVLPVVKQRRTAQRSERCCVAMMPQLLQLLQLLLLLVLQLLP